MLALFETLVATTLSVIAAWKFGYLGYIFLGSDLSPKSPPALRGVLGVKSLALGRHLVHCLSLQKFHWGQVAQG